MKLRFIHAPVPEVGPALTFYRDTLGWPEAWREGTGTVAFQLPGTDNVQVMVVVSTPDPPGPMYQVADLREYLASKPELTVQVPIREIPDGYVAGVTDPGGNMVYLFDQSGATG